MLNYPHRISLCGFGGQGIILSAVILGTTAVTKANLYAVQTQSYGSEARGGQCQGAHHTGQAHQLTHCRNKKSAGRHVSDSI